MPVELKLPELGEGIASGDVLEILVAVGDIVAKDQGIVELETEKATIAVPAAQAGVVSKIHVAVGQTVNVGQVLVSLEAPAEAGGEKAQAKPAHVAKQSAASRPQPATPAPRAPSPAASSAPVVHPEPQPNPERAAPVVAESAPQANLAAPTSAGMGSVPAGPSIRRFAREVGVDLRGVTGSGPGGRITRDDVLHVVRSGTPAQRANGAVSPGQRDEFGPIRIEKLSRIRRTIAEKMHLSWSTIPRVTNFDDADVTDLEEFRNESKADYAKQGIKLTSLPFVVKAVALALKANPEINASIDLSGGQIIYKEYVNVGIAVDTDRGLVVPSLRDADKLSIPQVARQIQLMAEAARTNSFTLADLKGSTFTISNLGAIGGSYSTPIINFPESAILLTGRARKMPIVIEDKVAIRLMLPLSISYDHRLIDGSNAARFLNDVIGYLQAPSRLLLAP
jgi:pyruvate/2-oxoglutarate dehydrogenase complex dihydrolipoamide acyltransferase (E2) component